jgi:hypothetical protein
MHAPVAAAAPVRRCAAAAAGGPPCSLELVALVLHMGWIAWCNS